MPLAPQLQGQFSGGGGLAGALETYQHQDGGKLAGRGQTVVAAAENFGQFFVNDLDDLLPRGQALPARRSPWTFP